MKIKSVSKIVVGAALSSAMILVGCGEPVDGPGTGTEPVAAGPKVDSTKPTLFKIGDELFAIPSPVQTALLIKETGAEYDKSILNDPAKHQSYSTKMKKALNLGVYGADMGYVTIYDKTQDAMQYMGCTRKLADELGVTGAFSKGLINRFEQNIGNKDSLLVLVTEAYRKTDAYLKDNQQDDVGGMILAGGWIEALHFSINVAQKSNDEKVIARIGEQKASLENMIKLIQKYANSPESQELMTELYDLYILFDEVEMNYEFVEPVTDNGKKVTQIKSKSSISISPETFQAISEKAESIRNHIVG